MSRTSTPSPGRVTFVAGLATGLSLLGDSSLYTVLPTHTLEAGVTLASVGVLLSANRFIRLVLNGPMGLAYDRWPRRRLFLPALTLGALSTAILALTSGFWPLLAARLLWGLAWAGIWVGGNTIILDVTRDEDRGRWVGLYQLAFFLGAASGALLGGFMTDVLGYSLTMGIESSLTLLGALIALLFLPETRRARPHPEAPTGVETRSDPITGSPARISLISATALMGVNRLVQAGVLVSTFGLFLAQVVGDGVRVGPRAIGVASLTGLGLGGATLIAMASAPLMGWLSDKARHRWGVAAGGLLPGIAGFSLLALGPPLGALVALPATAVTSGSNQSLSTALVGDLGGRGRRGRYLGLLYTVGDLASAVGPPLAYALIPLVGLRGVYLLSAGLLSAMLLLALSRVHGNRPGRPII